MTARHYRTLTLAPALVTGVVLAVAPPARAHHSTAPFDTTQTISVEGVVTRYEWANPHVYLWLAAPAENGETVEWEVEAQPAAILRRVGWSKETFKVGDAIEVTGNPARSERRKKLLLVSLKRADTLLYDGKSFMSALTTAAPAPAPGPDGIAGVWVTLLDMDAMRSYLNPAGRVPLTESGAAAQAAFDESTMSPGLKCIPVPAPAFMFAPDIKRITLADGLIRIAGEFAAAERVIRLTDAAGDDATAAPPSRRAIRSREFRRPLGRRDALDRDDRFRAARRRPRLYLGLEPGEAPRRAPHGCRGRNEFDLRVRAHRPEDARWTDNGRRSLGLPPGPAVRSGSVQPRKCEAVRGVRRRAAAPAKCRRSRATLL